MTKAGKIELEFYAFREEVEKRLAALEKGSDTKSNVKTEPKTEPIKLDTKKKIVIEAKSNDIVATEE